MVIAKNMNTKFQKIIPVDCFGCIHIYMVQHHYHWQVGRRYHEFRALRNALRAAAPHLAAQVDAPFPPKRLGLRRSHRSGKRDPQVIEGRAVALHRWLAEALTLEGAVQLPAVRAFLYLDRPLSS